MTSRLGHRRHAAAFEVRRSVAGDTAILHLDGELDFFAADSLRACVAELAGTGPAHVEVDLSELSFLDAGGLGTLIECRRRVGGWGGTIEFTRHPPAVERLARIAEVEALLDLYQPGAPAWATGTGSTAGDRR